MSIAMDEEIKRWTAKRKSALVMETIQGKKTVAEGQLKELQSVRGGDAGVARPKKLESLLGKGET